MRKRRERILSTSPYEEEWLRLPDSIDPHSRRDFQPVLTKKNGCDAISLPELYRKLLSTSPYEEEWLRQQAIDRPYSTKM
jgi:hypothetical protein